MPESRRPGVLVAHPSPDLYGADRVVLETIDAFEQAGWRVVVTIPGDGPLTAMLRSRGVAVTLCPTLVLRKAYLRPAGLVRLLGSIVAAVGPSRAVLRDSDADLVWVNTITLPLWALLARTQGRTVVVHAHEAEDGVSRAVRRCLALPLLLAHTVVVNSAATGRSLAEVLRRVASRTVRVYNGVRGPERPVEHRRVLGNPLRLVFVGRLSERKAPDLAVAALAELTRRGCDAVLEIVGSVFPGYEAYERELHDQVVRAGQTDRVVFTGFLPDVWDAYARSDVALVPSRVESLGNSAIEAMMSGTPLVAARTQGLPEVADGGRLATLVTPDDPSALADAVLALAADWDSARARATAARDDAERRFGRQRYRDDVVAVARDALPRNGTRAARTTAAPS